VHSSSHGGFPIDEKSANYIYQTNSHPGIIGYILLNAYQYFKHMPSKAEVTNGFYKYLHSLKLHDDLLNTGYRASPKFSDITTLACKCVLNGESFKASKDSFQEECEQLAHCLKMSTLVTDGNFVLFPSPIIQYRALGFYFGD